MAIGTKIGPDGRPLDEGFFGLGNALASLPGTPVLPGATTPPPATGGYSAPSAPIYGLDFGKGDIQDAGMGAFQLARGDRPEDIAARYAAGINNTGWGGPAPTVSRADENGMWNYSAPTSTYDPSQSNAQQAQLIQWLKGQIGQA
jgi:hypothetical protein